MNKTIYWKNDLLGNEKLKLCKGWLHPEGVSLPISDFGIDNKAKDGKRTHCKMCQKHYDDCEKNPFIKWYNTKKSTKTKAYARGDSKWEFNILPTDIKGVEGYFDPKGGTRGKWIITKYPLYCDAKGTPLDWSTDGSAEKFRHNRPSLDRYDPRIGYIPGNVRITTWKYNTVKNDVVPEELIEYGIAMINDSNIHVSEAKLILDELINTPEHNVNQLNLFENKKDIRNFCE